MERVVGTYLDRPGLGNAVAEGAIRCRLLLVGILWRATISSHLVTKTQHAALVGFDLRQMQWDVHVEILKESYPIANQDRQDRIANFIG